MHDDELNPKENPGLQDNEEISTYDDSITSSEELTKTKYAAGLYDDNPNVDYIDSPDDLNNLDAPLDAGTDRDADGDYDRDDSGLVPEDDDKDPNSETGLNEVELDNISPLMENAGDIVIDPEPTE